jgi:protein pelota
VKEAASYGAVDLLLVADALLREADDEYRREMEGIMRDVEKTRGKVMIVSDEHEAGQELMSLGGMAALLRFPVNSSSAQ